MSEALKRIEVLEAQLSDYDALVAELSETESAVVAYRESIDSVNAQLIDISKSLERMREQNNVLREIEALKSSCARTRSQLGIENDKLLKLKAEIVGVTYKDKERAETLMTTEYQLRKLRKTMAMIEGSLCEYEHTEVDGSALGDLEERVRGAKEKLGASKIEASNLGSEHIH